LNFDVYECGNCAGYVHVLWSAAEGAPFRSLHACEVLPWPLTGKPKASGNWPAAVQRFWVQARQSADSEIWDGASVMARSAMQAAFRDLGAVGRTLKDEVDDLSGKGLLPPEMNPQDTRDALEFLDQLLNYLYELPAAIQQYRRRREELGPQ
jgi:hypothetical protein